MFEYDNYKYFLLVVDCFSSKIFTVPLKQKDSQSVKNAFIKIFEEFNAKIYEIQTDRGKEFLGITKKLFEEKKILYRVKFGKNKANFAENSILLVKRKLYMQLRGTLSQNWIKNLSIVVSSLNNTPLKKLGWLKPNDIHSEVDSVIVSNAKKNQNIKSYVEPNYKIQRENQKNYEKTPSLQVNDYVYLDFDEKLFDKSFNVSVKMTFLEHKKLKRKLFLFKHRKNI